MGFDLLEFVIRRRANYHISGKPGTNLMVLLAAWTKVATGILARAWLERFHDECACCLLLGEEWSELAAQYRKAKVFNLAKNEKECYDFIKQPGLKVLIGTIGKLCYIPIRFLAPL